MNANEMEKARESFEGYLRANRNRLEYNSLLVFLLRAEWLLANPWYKDHEFFLKVVWDDTYAEPAVSCCGEGAKPVQHARGFHVEVVSEEEYRRMGVVAERAAGTDG